MSPARRLRILLLEDQALVRAGMKALIQISEPLATIREAASYEEAVEITRIATFDIAFLDIDLKEEQTGLDFLRYMRSLDVDTRAIMLSGRVEKDLVMTCIEAGASGYILKDMDSEGLFRRALDTVFQGNIFLPASVIGRGGFSPAPSVAPTSISAESIGVTGRSLEVLYYLCQGLPNKTIANRMGIEEATVRKDYVPKLFKLFRVTRRTELLVEISRRGLSVPTPTLLASDS
jgi:two-component system, NarL family, nitrate/nitrite response regulator NarL